MDRPRGCAICRTYSVACSSLHPVPNDWRFVESITDQLRSHALDVWLADGWAEELHGMIEPRPHHDVDLLCRADSFEAVDRFLNQEEIVELDEKRCAHKRAFEADETMVELILVHPDLTTIFWGEYRYIWPTDTFQNDTNNPRMISVSALHHYRRNRPPAQSTGTLSCGR